MRRIATGILGATLAATAPAAQELPRPRLDGDTNSAVAYYEMGARLMRLQPEEAATAFYWATRIDPEWATGWYGLRLALYNTDYRLIARYPSLSGRALEAPEIIRYDSLQLRAEMLDPLFPRDLEREFLERTVAAQLRDAVSRGPGSVTVYVLGGPVEVQGDRMDPTGRGQEVDPAIIDHVSREILGSDAAYLPRALIAAGDNRQRAAVDLFRRALPESRVKPMIHAHRARAFQALGQLDSALAAMRQAIADIQRPEFQRWARLFETVAAYEYITGVMLERGGRSAEAREAYDRALAADSTYHAARHRLGLLSLAAGDTAAALRDLERAIDYAPQEVGQRVTFALLLAQSRRGAQAVPHLRRAIELAPYYAWAYYVLGRVIEGGDAAGAAAAYRDFLARAPADHARRDDATQRLQRLAP